MNGGEGGGEKGKERGCFWPKAGWIKGVRDGMGG